jgi:hypothetical protein
MRFGSFRGDASGTRFGARRSQVSRRCRPRIAAIAAVAVIAALAPVPGAAQIMDKGVAQIPDPLTDVGSTPNPNPNDDLLQPWLQGTPATPPRLRRSNDAAQTDQTPAPDKFTAPSRIGATPLYGSPPGFGAGNTGYDSSNTPPSKKKKLAQTPPPTPGVIVPETTFDPLPTTQFAVPPTPPAPTPTPPLPAEIYPKKAANRPGAVLPLPAEPRPVSNPPPEVYPLSSANRPGASTPVPPPTAYELPIDTTDTLNPPPSTPPPNTLPLGTQGQRPLPLGEGDAYAPLGIRGGSFMFFPSIEFDAAYASNPSAVPGGPGSPYFVVAPELKVQSDWSRHSLTADIVGTYTDFTNGSFQPSLNRPYLNSTIDGRIDVSRETQIVLENRVIVTTDNPGSPNLSAGLASLPIDTTVGGTIGVVQNFNRLNVALRGTIDSANYQNSMLTDGESASNADRDFNQYGINARVGYEIDPGLTPFVQVQEDERVYGEQFDRFDQQRNSTGTTAQVGAKVDLFGSLTGEIAVGYVMRDYIAPLPDVSGVVANGALIWQATALTTAKLTATSVVNESIVQNASATLSRDLSLQVDHALRRWLIATVKAGYGNDDYVGIGRDDNRYFASIGLQYILNRDVSVRGELRHDWLTSNTPNVGYQSTSVLMGLRLQR